MSRIPTLWKIAGAVVAVPLLVGGTFQAVGVVAHEESRETTTVAASGIATVDVRNRAGAVRVIGVDGADRITVRARISDGLRATRHDVATEGDRLVVTGDCPLIGNEWCSVMYTLEVPSDVALKLRADGRIEVSGVAGGVDAGTDQGRIVLDQVDGTVRADSDQGRIEGRRLTGSRVRAHTDQGHVTLSFLASPRAVDAQSDQGGIDIVLPDDRDVAYAVDTGTDQGTVTDAIRQDPRSDRTIRAHSDQGDVTISYARG